MKHFWVGFIKAAADRKEVSTVGAIKDGKLLMGKRRDNGKWTNPGGHLDPGEDPLDGAVRELYEESGIKCDPKDLVHLLTEDVITPTGKKYRIHAYKLELSEDAGTSMKDDPDAEVERWHWLKMPLNGDVMGNLHSPKNVLLKGLGLMEKTANHRREIRDFYVQRQEFKDVFGKWFDSFLPRGARK